MEQPDFELKLARSRHHLHRLEDEIDGFLNAVIESVEEEPDPENASYQRAWVTGDDPPHYPIALLIGDCLQCMRTGLDQLAFALAASFTSPLPDEIAKDSEFPILPYADKEGREIPLPWRSRGGGRKIRGIDPAAQEIIERKQPYNAGSAFESEPLWVLHDLNRIDKHRLLHSVTASFSGIILPPRHLWLNVAAIEHGTIRWGRQRVEGRTEIARWPARPIDPRKEMRLGVVPSLDVVFEDSVPLVGGRPVRQTLLWIYNHVVRDVITPLRPFLK